MNKQKVLLFVGAHPDDETFGPGAILAQYVAYGVKVYYLCATRGEAGTVDPALLQGYDSVGDLRWAELIKAVKILGLTGLFYLGYRDSGMSGSQDNTHSNALINATIEELTGRIVRFFRQLKPDVVITHDPSGGYGHPDHIAIYQATLKAFHDSVDSRKYPDTGPGFQVKKLYCLLRPHRFTKILIRFMQVMGRDPHHFGRNKDIDLVKMLVNEYPTNASIYLKKKYISIQDKAASCHASQMGGRLLNLGFVNKILKLFYFIFGRRQYFMRVYPTVKNKQIETDLFQDI